MSVESCQMPIFFKESIEDPCRPSNLGPSAWKPMNFYQDSWHCNHAFVLKPLMFACSWPVALLRFCVALQLLFKCSMSLQGRSMDFAAPLGNWSRRLLDTDAEFPVHKIMETSSSWNQPICSATRRLGTSSKVLLDVDRSSDISKLRTSRDHTKYFLSERDKLKPSQVCSILEGLWKSIVDEHGGSGLRDAKKQLFNDPDFMAIMKDVVFKLDRYKADDLPRLIGALNTMRWNDKQLFKIMEPMVIQEMPSMNCTGLSQVANSFVVVGCGSRLLFNQLIQCCFQASDHFVTEDVALLTSAFSKAPHKPKTFLLGFAAVVSRHLSSFSERQLQDIIVAYSSWPLDVPADFVEEMVRSLLQNEQHIGNMSMSNLVLILRFWPFGIQDLRQHETIEADGKTYYLQFSLLQTRNFKQAKALLLKNLLM